MISLRFSDNTVPFCVNDMRFLAEYLSLSILVYEIQLHRLFSARIQLMKATDRDAGTGGGLHDSSTVKCREKIYLGGTHTIIG